MGPKQRIFLVSLFFITLSTAAAIPARADDGPRLRPTIEVSAPHITLGDLFENAGPLASRAVLAAPVPGERFHLSLAQIFELAANQGLAWRPLASFEYVEVGRAWRYLDSGDIRNGLIEALARQGAPDRLTIDLPPAALKVKVARGTLAEISFENTSYSRTNDRFQTTLVVHSAGGDAQRFTLAGTAFAEVEVPVLNARLRPDQIIRDSDIQFRVMRASRLPANALTNIADLVGLSPIRTATPGRVLTADMVGAPTAVARGALVAMHLTSQNMHLVATGRAQESGAIGDLIQVQNADSRITVDAVVTGINRVEVRTAALLAAR